MTGETVWPMPPLTVPDPKILPTESAALMRVLMNYPGVQLFVERAQEVQKAFALKDVNAPVVAQIVARLDNHLSLLTGGAGAGPTGSRRCGRPWIGRTCC